MTPELIRGAEATPASDVYAFGCFAFECIAGEPPFAGKGPFDVARAHVAKQPSDPLAVRPDLPRGLAWAVLQALSKEPEERLRTAKTYADMLRLAARS